MGRDFEDVVEAAPDAIGFFAVGKGEDFHEEEEGGVVLLDSVKWKGEGFVRVLKGGALEEIGLRCGVPGPWA